MPSIIVQAQDLHTALPYGELQIYSCASASMSTLADFTAPELLAPELRSRDAAGVTAELCSTLERHGRVLDLLPFYHAVMTRELLSSTAIPPGWALPHARLAGLPQLCFALGRSPEPLTWFGQRGKSVQMVFLFAVPETETATYLALVSGLAKLSQDPVRVDRLLEAQDRQAMFAVLEEIALRLPRAGVRRAACEMPN